MVVIQYQTIPWISSPIGFTQAIFDKLVLFRRNVNFTVNIFVTHMWLNLCRCVIINIFTSMLTWTTKFYRTGRITQSDQYHSSKYLEHESREHELFKKFTGGPEKLVLWIVALWKIIELLMSSMNVAKKTWYEKLSNEVYFNYWKP